MEKFDPKKGVWEKVSDIVPAKADSFVVPKLKKGEQYKFRVSAENRAGVSEPLEGEELVTAKDPYGEASHVLYM